MAGLYRNQCTRQNPFLSAGYAVVLRFPAVHGFSWLAVSTAVHLQLRIHFTLATCHPEASHANYWHLDFTVAKLRDRHRCSSGHPSLSRKPSPSSKPASNRANQLSSLRGISSPKTTSEEEKLRNEEDSCMYHPDDTFRSGVRDADSGRYHTGARLLARYALRHKVK
jgi:hypothetical protein